MTTTEATTTHDTADIDLAAVEEFAGTLVQTMAGALTTALIDIGRRTRLFELATQGPATSQELADRGGLHERYVREWLAAMATAGIVEYDAHHERFWLPLEHAALLTGDSNDNLTSLAYLVQHVVKQAEAVARCFTEGGGVPYSAYQPEIHDVMDVLWQPMYRDLAVQHHLPLAPGLVDALESGIRVADLACGAGNLSGMLARRYPRSTFVGFDLDDAAIAVARQRHRDADNVRYEVADVATLREDEPFDAVLVFNAVHDQARPLEFLTSACDLLRPGGTFLMNEPRISSVLADNIQTPETSIIYGISLLHCMTVSLAEGGAGLGTGWGEQVAVQLLTDAGFGPVDVHDAEGDPTNAIFVTHRPG
ncbi:MAG TPA: methyltransferase domain-containing protein [Nocardioidaceae bacterium]|nr:methyltransferase domain-containing protein [Nocardioidaceae bacterium]